MTDYVYAAMLAVIWVSLGLAAVLIFISRHGRRSGWWYVVGVILGPILLPIAAEIGDRGEPVLHWRGEPPAPTAGAGAPAEPITVLAAVDGSTESDLAIRGVARVAPPGSRVHLITVLDPDTVDDATSGEAGQRLRERTAWLTNAPASVTCEVASGDPVETILAYAALHEVDLVVAGRRGHGLSPRLLGSVADRLVRHSPRPVLLGAMIAPGHHPEQ